TEPVRTSRRGDLYTYQGEALTLAQWARRVNLRIDTLFLRFKSGKTLAEALTIPLRGKIS
ncbi:MAG: hypothetical protein Q8R07_04960, partial [Candidatus Uhrbacteria bacterium]|nr:hypothetical protein [Candidatus Uhrbacteria bacterium]